VQDAVIRTAVSTTTEYTVRDQERMKLASNYFGWQRRITLPHLGKRVVEIGCGVGNFTRHLLDREHVTGIDVVPECVASHRKNFSGYAHVRSSVQDVSDLKFLELRNVRPDSIVCLNVLEHIDDHITALRHMCAILPEGGRAVLIVPAFEALYGPIDGMLGHFRRYSKKSFLNAAQQAGFVAERMYYMNSVGFFGWWVNAHILKRTEQSEAQIAMFDSRIVPLLEPLENVVKPPFGQSLFAVLVKNRA
jgi:2-polyprenyl-3-methyl-5-hydroxy-6-metoxy-1,4-benzoquinol methylase